MGCLAELKQLSASFSPEDKLFFCGNYCDIGPDPLGTVDYLMTLTNAVFYCGDHDRQLLMAMGLIPEGPFERIAWFNPYTGISRTLNAYGVAGLKFLRDRGRDKNEVLEKVLARGHLDFWKTVLATGSIPQPPTQMLTIALGESREEFHSSITEELRSFVGTEVKFL